MPPRRLLTNEYEEAISALEFTAESVQRLGASAYRWKWVILGMHSAVQGLMVLALRNGNGLAALADDVAARWLEAYRSGATLPEERMDKFLNLYKKIKSERMLFFVGSKRFVPSGDQNESIKILNRLRNSFIHFLPCTWSLQLSGLPKICFDCIGVCEFLINSSGNILWHKRVQRIRSSRALRDIRRALLPAAKRFH